jgi:hypothetical protein
LLKKKGQFVVDVVAQFECDLIGDLVSVLFDGLVLGHDFSTGLVGDGARSNVGVSNWSSDGSSGSGVGEGRGTISAIAICETGSSGVGESIEAGIRQVLGSSGDSSHQNSQNHLYIETNNRQMISISGWLNDMRCRGELFGLRTKHFMLI